LCTTSASPTLTNRHLCFFAPGTCATTARGEHLGWNGLGPSGCVHRFASACVPSGVSNDTDAASSAYEGDMSAREEDRPVRVDPAAKNFASRASCLSSSVRAGAETQLRGMHRGRTVRSRATEENPTRSARAEEPRSGGRWVPAARALF
jgi:hypothetical protein